MKYKRIRTKGSQPVNLGRNQALYLKVTTNEAWDFYALYDTLTNIQKRIWVCLVNWCKNYPNAFPSQSTIAKKCKCGRQHVNRTIAKFKGWGWLSLNSRGIRRTKSISISTRFIQIDIVNRQYFRKIEATTAVTHNYYNYKKETSKAGELVVSSLVDKLNMSYEHKLKMSLLPEDIVRDAIHVCQKKSSDGFKFTNPCKYLLDTGFRMAKQQGIYIPWRKFYSTNSRIYQS